MKLGLGYRLAVLALAFAIQGGTALAQGAKIVESEVDPAIFRIDEERFLGVKPDAALKFRDDKGRLFTFGDMTGQPLILVLSYYNCDGTCSVVNNDLAAQLQGVTRLAPGKDYRILTVSFDPHDTVETLRGFDAKLKLPEPLRAAWRFSLPGDDDDAGRLARSVGFKYFWSPRDRTFLHPGVFIFLSGEGRVVRYLYSMNTKALDVELALVDAIDNQIKPSQVVDYALSMCYSYNYKEGRYTLNMAFIIGFGSLIFGVLALFVSMLVYRRRVRQREIKG